MTVNSLMTQLSMPTFTASAELDLQFFNSLYLYNGTYRTNLANVPGWSFSRTDTNGTATALDLAGNIIQFATGVPRITNRGILVEEARTNSFEQTGLPNFWVVTASQNGLTGTIVGTGTENGMPYQEVRAVGTATSTFFDFGDMGSGFRTAATSGQTFTGGCGAKIISGAGSVTGLSVTLVEESAGNVFVGQTITQFPVVNGVFNRVSSTRTMGATAATCRLARVITFSPGDAVDITVRFYLPQLEQGAFATSPIITTGAAGTRGADAGRITQSPTASGTIIATVRIPTDKNNRRVAGTNGTSGVTPLAYSTAGIETYNGSSTLGKTVSMAAGELVTVGVTWESGRRSVTGAGLAVATDANSIGSFTEMWFGQDDSLLAGNALNESIVRVQVLPYAVTDAQLQALTAP